MTTGRPERRAGAGIGVLATAAWVAAVVAGNGFISLFTGREVVPVADAGPLAEPIGVLLAAVLIAVRASRSTATSTLLPVECLLIGYLLPLLGSGLVALFAGGLQAAVLLVGRTALAPFPLVAAVLAGIAGLVVLLLVRARDAGAGPPRWPWEGRDEA